MKKFFGWFCVSFAVLGIGTEWDHFIKHTQVNTGVGISMILIFGTVGLMLLRSASRNKSPATIEIRKAEALPVSEHDAVEECAVKLGGSVTVTDVASDLGLGFAEAKKQLDGLEKAGRCRAETRDGAVYYDFELSTNRATSARLKNRIGGPQ